MKAVGCHVFAGGFSIGVREVMECSAQLEVHGLGMETVTERLGMDFIVGSDWQDWPKLQGDFLFGNPRCTGFSCVTAGHGEEVRGAWSKPTKDIHQLCNYGVHHRFPVICWESVQQAMSVGRPLLNWLRENLFEPNGYAIAHVLVNAASLGNAQHRRRYFFMAYRPENGPFNVLPMPLLDRHVTVGDVVMNDSFMRRKARAHHFTSKRTDYDEDCYMLRCRDDVNVVQVLPKGWDVNRLARNRIEDLERVSAKYSIAWWTRNSDMPFSMHCVHKLHDEYSMPVISGSCGRFAHPVLDRFMTVGELSRLMGWPQGVIPAGPNPFAELGKGVCPEVGKWLAEQVVLHLSGYWKNEHWESGYDPVGKTWYGKTFESAPAEKVFDLTDWCPERPSRDCMEAA